MKLRTIDSDEMAFPFCQCDSSTCCFVSSKIGSQLYTVRVLVVSLSLSRHALSRARFGDSCEAINDNLVRECADEPLNRTTL